MPFDDHKNFGYSTVATAPSPALSGTSLTVATGQGALFPAAPFNVTIWPASAFPLASNAEIARVTAVVGDVLTIVRAQEGTSARAITVGDQIANTITSKVITDIEAEVAAGGITNAKFSAGTLSALRSDLTFGDSNGISFGLDTDGVITGTVRTNYQSFGAYLTTAALSQDSSKYAGTNGAITGGSITVNTSGVSVNLPAYLTTAMASNRGSDFVQANAGFHGTNATGTIASNAISVSVAAQTVQTQNLVAVSLSGNTAGLLALVSSGTFILAGGNNITVSQNGQSVTISGANAGGAQTGISGIVVSDTTYTSGTVSFSNQANVTIGSSVNGGTQYIRLSGHPAQTVQTQNLHNVTLDGNTAGALADISSGTMTLAGGNNITLSQNGNAITISGANAGGAQTGISGIVVSDATYTSGTVSFSAQNNITIGSSVDGATQFIRLSIGNYLTTAMASNRGSDFVQATAGFNGTNASGTIASNSISVSVAAPIPIATSVNPVASASSIGTVTRYAPEDHRHPGIGAVGISTAGNSAGTSGSQIGTYWFQGGNSITLSQITSNNGSHTLVISAGNYLTTAMASNRGSDFVQATAVFNGTNATGTIASGAISVSVAAPIPIATTVGSVASANSVGTVTRYAPEDHKHAGIGGIGISTSGNTAGTTGSVLGTYWFEGGNSITVSQITSNNGSHTLRLSVGNYLTTAMASNRGSDFVQATAVFNGTNATGTIASGAISVSVAAPIPIGTNVKAVASIGSTGTITRYAPEDHQHRGVAAFAVTNTGNTLGDTRSQVGTLFIAASGAITASQSTAAAGNDTVWLSVAAQTVQTQNLHNVTLSGNTAGVMAQISSGTLTLAGGNNITLSQNGNAVTISGANAGGVQTGISSIIVSDATYTSGMVSFSNQANITIGSSVDGVTQYIRLSGNAAQTVQTQSLIAAVYDGANSISTGTIRFTNANGVSFSINGQTISGSVLAQSNQSLGLYAVSNTTGESSSSTFDARTLSFHGAGIASVGYSNGSIVVSVPEGGGGLSNVRVSAGTTSNLLSAVTFADSNGVSFGIDASTVTASVDTYATVGTATTVTPVASANSVGTVTRWAAEDHRHAGVGGIGISTAGNTAGTTGSQVGTYWLQGGNNVTVSQITSNNGSHTLVVSAGGATMSAWPNILPGSTAVSTYYSGSTSIGGGGNSTRTGYTFSLYAVPFPLPAALAFSEIRVGVSNQSVAATGSATHMFSLGFYSNNASTLSLVSAFYGGIVLSQNSVTAQTFSVFTATTAGATSGAGGGMAGISKHSVYSSQGNISANSQIFGRLQFIRIDSGAAATLPAGQYYVVFGNATASSGANVLSNVGILQSNAIFSQNIPDVGRENSTQTSNYLPAWGAISTTFSSNSNAAEFFPLPSAIAISNMTLSQSSAQRFHFPVMRNHS